jgi:nickel-dependent lactate racemase
MDDSYIRSLHGPVPLPVPVSWQVLTIADFHDSPSSRDVAALVDRALEAPVAAAPLEKQIDPGATVCILIEDLTRTSPKKTILSKLLQRLRSIGVQREDIVIVIALGTHQPLSEDELKGAFGDAMVATYSFHNHDCRAADLVPVGQLASGAAVKINRAAYESDHRVGIGSIFPHPLNGFGGGGKILFPGVADFDSIVEHHLKHSFQGNACLGTLEDNPFYEEVTAMAAAGRLDFIINSVLDHNDQLHDLVCRDPVQAHRFGAGICTDIISQPFPARSDVTVISAFPYAAGPQIMKPLAPADMITRKGGSIILYADCELPLPENYFRACEAFRAAHGGRLREKVLEQFAANRPIMPGAPPELNMSMAQVMLAQNDHEVVLVTKDIAQNQVERLGFGYAEDIEAAIAICEKRYTNPTVNIVPSGGVILPIVSESEA